MTKITWRIAVACALALGCGGGSGGASIIGAEPAEQAEEIASVLCEWEDECGNVTISCSFMNNMTDCTGTIEQVTFDQCYAETHPDFLALFQTCPDLTVDQERTIQTCFNSVAGESCISQAELDAYVAKLEAGDETATLRDPVPECAEAFQILEACEPQ